jgi:hypothetical protein
LFLCMMSLDITTEKVICSGSKMPSVTVSELLWMTCC